MEERQVRKVFLFGLAYARSDPSFRFPVLMYTTHIGSGIVVSFLDTGAIVTLVEANAEALERSTNVVRFIYGNRVKKGQMTMEDAVAIGKSVRMCVEVCVADNLTWFWSLFLF